MLIYPGDELTSQPSNYFKLSPRLIIRPAALFVGSAGSIDLARNKKLTPPASLSWPETPYGIAAKLSGGTGAGFTVSGGKTTAQTRVCFLTVVRLDSALAYQGLIASSGASNSGFNFCDIYGAGTSFGIVKTGVSLPPSGVTLTSGKYYAIAASNDQATGEYYVLARDLSNNSLLRASSSSYTNVSNAGNGTYCVGVGRSDIVALNGAMSLGVLAFDFLPEPAASEFVRNPWGIFAPEDLFVWLPDAGGASVSLTGNAGTSSAGVVAPSISASTTGVSATSAAGSLSPSAGSTASVSGTASTAAAGTLSPAVSRAVTGSQCSTAAGALSAGLSKSIVGVAATSSVGTLSPSAGATASISGAASATATGALAATLSITLGGTSVTAAVGTLTLPGSYSAALTASQTTTSAGTAAPSVSKSIVGVQSTTSVGSLSAVTGATASLSGVQTTSAAGALSKSVALTIAGCQSTTFAGALGKISSVSGQEATTSVGTMNASTEPFVVTEVLAARTLFVKPKRSTDITVRERQKSVTVRWS